MKKQHLFEYRLFSAIFHTQQSKNDVIGVIMTSFWICTIMPSLVLIGQQIKQKQKRGTMCPQRICTGHSGANYHFLPCNDHFF